MCKNYFQKLVSDWTYGLSAAKWWMDIFCKHTKRNIFAEIEAGNTTESICKVRFNEIGQVHLTNGRWESMNHFIMDDFANRMCDHLNNVRKFSGPIYVHMLLDTKREDIEQELCFIELVNKIKEMGKDRRVYVYGGQRCFDGEQVVVNISPEKPNVHKYSKYNLERTWHLKPRKMHLRN